MHVKGMYALYEELFASHLVRMHSRFRLSLMASGTIDGSSLDLHADTGITVPYFGRVLGVIRCSKANIGCTVSSPRLCSPSRLDLKRPQGRVPYNLFAPSCTLTSFHVHHSAHLTHHAL